MEHSTESSQQTEVENSQESELSVSEKEKNDAVTTEEEVDGEEEAKPKSHDAQNEVKHARTEENVNKKIIVTIYLIFD